MSMAGPRFEPGLRFKSPFDRFFNLGLIIIKMIVFEHNIQMEHILKISSDKS